MYIIELIKSYLNLKYVLFKNFLVKKQIYIEIYFFLVFIYLIHGLILLFLICSIVDATCYIEANFTEFPWTLIKKPLLTFLFYILDILEWILFNT